MEIKTKFDINQTVFYLSYAGQHEPIQTGKIEAITITDQGIHYYLNGWSKPFEETDLCSDRDEIIKQELKNLRREYKFDLQKLKDYQKRYEDKTK